MSRESRNRLTLVGYAAAALLGAMAAALLTPHQPPAVHIHVPAHAERAAQVRLMGDEADDGKHVNAGWIDDQAEVKAVVATLPIRDFADTDAAKAVTGDGDVFLWQAAHQVLGHPLDPRDQLDVGSCVSFGYAAAVDILQLFEIAEQRRLGRGPPREYRPACQEAIYGGSRVEVGGGRLRGDGSVGAWAAKWVQDRGGIVWRAVIGKFDLTKYDTRRCREWGSRGVPDELEEAAKAFKVGSAAKVSSAEDLAKAIRQGYPGAICSNQGFARDRDSEGFARAQGSWAHCMAVLAVRGGPRPGFFIWNSWGRSYHRGPLGPGSPPEGGFWADWAVVDRMVRGYNDTFVVSSFAGFPARRLDWLASVTPPARPPATIPAPRRDVGRDPAAAVGGQHVLAY
jgi:hypothetical protein